MKTTITNLEELKQEILKLDPNAEITHKYHKQRMIRELNCTIYEHNINKTFKSDKEFKRYLTFLPYAAKQNNEIFKAFTQQYSYREYRSIFDTFLNQFTN